MRGMRRTLASQKNAGQSRRILHLSWHLAIAIPSRRLAALEGNGSALDAGVGFFGFNNHRLPIAERSQGQTGGKRCTVDHDVNVIAFRCAGNFSGNVPAGFAPAATAGVRSQSRAGEHVKIITIAGATNIQLKIILLLQHIVCCPALDWLARAICEFNCPASRPLTRKLGERACALGMTACRYQPKSKNNNCGSYRLARGERSESHDKIQYFERVIAKDATPGL